MCCIITGTMTYTKTDIIIHIVKVAHEIDRNTNLTCLSYLVQVHSKSEDQPEMSK